MAVHRFALSNVASTALALACLAACGTLYATESEPPKPLDAKTYKQRCLLCHSTATPEGIAPWVVEKVAPREDTSGGAPAHKTSPLRCWRRCPKCWPG